MSVSQAKDLACSLYCPFWFTEALEPFGEEGGGKATVQGTGIEGQC